MAVILVYHKECDGIAIETDSFHHNYAHLLEKSEDLHITCLTCLQEITDPSELRISEELNQ